MRGSYRTLVWAEVMETLIIPIEIRQDETRQSPGRLIGTLLTYETRAGDRPEIFSAGALRWPADGFNVNVSTQPASRRCAGCALRGRRGGQNRRRLA